MHSEEVLSVSAPALSSAGAGFLNIKLLSETVILI